MNYNQLKTYNNTRKYGNMLLLPILLFAVLLVAPSCFANPQQQQYRNQPQSSPQQQQQTYHSQQPQSSNQRENVRFGDKCRPDQIISEQNGNCTKLARSISDTVREILENSEATLSLSHYHLGDGSGPVPDHVPVSDLFVQNLAVISESNMSECLSIAACTEHCWSWPERTPEQRHYEEDVVSRFALPELLSNVKSDKEDQTTSADDPTENGPTENEEAGIASGLDFVNTIMTGSKRGIDLAKSGKVSTFNRSNVCGRCFTPNSHQGTAPAPATCTPQKYGYTTRINAIYRQLIERNVTLYNRIGRDLFTVSKITPEILYYHYSMRFLDVANLTDCFARVSCETSCDVYQQSLAGLDDEDRQSKNMPDPPPNVSPFATLTIDIDKPRAIETIHNGSLLGYKLAIESRPNLAGQATNTCNSCARQYRNCAPDRYRIARASLTIFG